MSALRLLYDKARRYQRVHGTRQLLRESLVRLGVRDGTGRGLPVTAGTTTATGDDRGWVSARELVKAHRASMTPLQLFEITPQSGDARISLVTDSINAGSLYGGVGTALILAALVAEARGARLRVVTRTERANQAGLELVLRLNGITLTREVEFAFHPCYEAGHDLNRVAGELFITTSWWTTASTLASVAPASVVYLLQEDERMFYPYGDEHLQCSHVLARADITHVVNTHLLLEHLVASGLGHLRASALTFEPSFPPSVFCPRPRTQGAKRTLFFYARPHNQRNLFLFGLELLEAALARGILDLDAWDIVLVGKDIPKLRFDDGRYTPRRRENLTWREYANLAGEIDLALSLMYTPHPSYPPLDFAASGAVVVTNRFGNKTSLSDYSPNILTGDLDIEAMLPVLADGLALAVDDERRAANFRANRLETDWRTSLAGVVERLSSLR